MEDGFNLRFGMGTLRIGTPRKNITRFRTRMLVSDVLPSVRQTTARYIEQRLNRTLMPLQDTSTSMRSPESEGLAGDVSEIFQRFQRTEGAVYIEGLPGQTGMQRGPDPGTVCLSEVRATSTAWAELCCGCIMVGWATPAMDTESYP